MFHAHKNQARFFIARNDFNRVGDYLFRAFKKFCGVQCLAQRVRTDNAHACRIKALQAFGEQRQASQPALHCLFAQHVIAVQTISQVHALFQAADDLHCAVDHTRNDHMETV